MADAPSAATIRDADPEQEEEEEETCGFCIFMKAGGCKPEFTVCAEENTSKLRSRTRARAECEPLSQNWEKCVGQARETDQDFTEGCRDQTQALQQCMQENKEYYAPLLEGQSSALDAAEDSSEDHSEASALTEMAPIESKQQESGPSEQPHEDFEPELQQQQSQAGGHEESSPAESSKMSDGNNADAQTNGDAQTSNGGQLEAKKESQSAPDQAGGDDGQSKEEAAGDDGSVGGDREPFNLPHPGEEDKTDMPGEPEPEPEEDGAGEEEEEEVAPPEVKVESTPFDVRFPGTNQARHCYTRYNEYHKCTKQNGEDDERCNMFQKAYRSICPGEWVERWNEQRDNGTWPGRW